MPGIKARIADRSIIGPESNIVFDYGIDQEIFFPNPSIKNFHENEIEFFTHQGYHEKEGS